MTRDPFHNQDSFIWLDQFLGYLQAIKERSPGTIKEYRYDLLLFFRFMLKRRKMVPSDQPIEHISVQAIDEALIQSISLADLYAFVTWLSVERHNGPSARARRIAALKTFFGYLKNKARILTDNVALELESPKLLRRLPRHFSLEESQQLLDTTADSLGDWSSRDYCMMTLFLNCGLRLSELCSINQSNIRSDTLTVLGKGGKERTIYLNAACLDALSGFLADRKTQRSDDPDALFVSRIGQRISPKTVQILIKKYIQAAGLDPTRYSTHKLRHTAATLMYKYGKVDIRALQAILGHASISTTEIYTHIDADSLHDAVSRNPLSQSRRRKSGES